MEIVLARHGNTFRPGEKAVWVGRETDLPLVEKGIEQAHAVAAALRREGLPPTRALAAPLQRTRRFAEIVVEDLGRGLTLSLDQRLSEIDYGRWAGKTAQEIADELGHQALLRRWNEDDIWPEGAGWGSTESEIVDNIKSLFADLRATCGPDDRALIVSSNGLLRLVPRVLGLNQAATARRSFHIKTGSVAVIEFAAGAFVLGCWDVEPADLILPKR